MRIVSYNILDGGLGRADPLAEVLLAQRPDVACLVEADRPGYLGRIGRRLGCEPLHLPGNGRDAAVLTTRPIDSAANLRLVTGGGPRSWAEVVIDGLPITVVHLSPHRPRHAEATRCAELRPVLDRLAARRAAGEPHVVVGDFNAVHPEQRIDEARLRPGDLHGYREDENVIPRDAIAMMLDAGYDDAHDGPLDVSDPAACGTLDTVRRGLRVDYIFTFGCEVVDAWIETDRLATYASDHYPVGAEIRR